MLPTLENALEKISKLESRITRLEKIFIGRNKSAPSPISSVQTSQPSSKCAAYLNKLTLNSRVTVKVST